MIRRKEPTTAKKPEKPPLEEKARARTTFSRVCLLGEGPMTMTGWAEREADVPTLDTHHKPGLLPARAIYQKR